MLDRFGDPNLVQLHFVCFPCHVHGIETKETLRATGLKTKREAVELGLRTLLRLQQQQQIRRFRGKLKWEGDLEAMRIDK